MSTPTLLPATQAALEAVTARGGRLIAVDAGHMRVEPPEAATSQDMAALTEGKAWIIAAWQAAAAWDAANRPNLDSVPLPGNGDDDAWKVLLSLASAIDGADRHGSERSDASLTKKRGATTLG